MKFSFHLSGIGNAAVTTGFPRLRKLITNNKSHDNVLRLYLKPQFAQDESNAVRAARYLKNITLEQLVVERTIIPIDAVKDIAWFTLWRMIHQLSLFAEENLHVFMPFVGQLKLNKAATLLCTTPNILQHICQQIQQEFPGLVAAVSSPSCLHEPMILLFVTNDLVHRNKTSHNMNTDAFVKKIVRELPEFIEVNGVSGVTEVFVRGGPHSTQNDDYMVRQGFVDKNEYFVETNGGDITECFITASDLLDEKRSIPTNPAYAHNVLGVEACRQIMLLELQKVLADTSHVDNHHVTLLVDCMLQSGHLVSVTRQSQQKVRFSGVLDIATFEQGIKVMTNAAHNHVADNLKGTSARIAVGRPVQAGTGFFDLFVPPPT